MPSFQEKMTAKELADELDFGIFPNPTSNSFFIKNESIKANQITYQLFDYQGVSIFSKEIFLQKNQSHEVQVEDLPSGIYFIKIENENTFSLQKIIISH